ncbi:hypothetical protein Thpro_021503 [Acidihalobacter prosperus]|uniref:Uncharacterized protein n=1 Tax=Acidihalobacter prosperus TaxID=160660 RepID=A0A1A6C3Q3_9GAMM|nr:hypothetical protein Thpro_021503 [Acidihalobacter prosperus]
MTEKLGHRLGRNLKLHASATASNAHRRPPSSMANPGGTHLIRSENETSTARQAILPIDNWRLLIILATRMLASTRAAR